ncbi:hypothetical protein ACHWQZ_G005887 [Mnemiopsis leidyi]
MLAFLLLFAFVQPAGGASDVPTFEIIIYPSGIKKLEDSLYDRVAAAGKNFTENGAVALPDVSSSSYKLRNMRLTGLGLDRPEVQVVPDTGLRIRQTVSKCTVKADYEIKVLFFSHDGELDITTSFTVDVMGGVEYTEQGGLAISGRSCSVTFHTFDINLHNLIFSTAAKLMKEKITSTVEEMVCKEVGKSFRDFSIMDQIPFAKTGKFDNSPTVVFKADKIEFSVRISSDSNINPMPVLDNAEKRMICLTVSKKFIGNTSDKTEMTADTIIETVKTSLPILKDGDVNFKEMGDFFVLCADF